jgi:hypothetical protein
MTLSHWPLSPSFREPRCTGENISSREEKTTTRMDWYYLDLAIKFEAQESICRDRDKFLRSGTVSRADSIRRIAQERGRKMGSLFPVHSEGRGNFTAAP